MKRVRSPSPKRCRTVRRTGCILSPVGLFARAFGLKSIRICGLRHPKEKGTGRKPPGPAETRQTSGEPPALGDEAAVVLVVRVEVAVRDILRVSADIVVEHEHHD